MLDFTTVLLVDVDHLVYTLQRDAPQLCPPGWANGIGMHAGSSRLPIG